MFEKAEINDKEAGVGAFFWKRNASCWFRSKRYLEWAIFASLDIVQNWRETFSSCWNPVLKDKINKQFLAYLFTFCFCCLLPSAYLPTASLSSSYLTCPFPTYIQYSNMTKKSNLLSKIETRVYNGSRLAGIFLLYLLVSGLGGNAIWCQHIGRFQSMTAVVHIPFVTLERSFNIL